MKTTLNEILQSPIAAVYEDEMFYYVRPQTTEIYDTTLWKVDKRSKNVVFMDFPQFMLENFNNCKEIDPEDLK